MDPNRPGLEPPEGVIPNFDNPPNDNGQANAGIVICLLLVFTSVSLRAYSKLFCVKQVHFEDCKHLNTHRLLFDNLLNSNAP